MSRKAFQLSITLNKAPNISGLTSQPFIYRILWVRNLRAQPLDTVSTGAPVRVQPDGG